MRDSELPARRGPVRRGRLRLGPCLLLLLSTIAAAVTLPVATARPGAAAGNGPGLRLLGALEVADTNYNGTILGFDRGRRRMYYMYGAAGGTWLATYDLRARIPKRVGADQKLYDGLPPSNRTPYTVFVDEGRNRIGFLASGSAQGQDSVIRLVDLGTRQVSTWNLVQALPGYVGTGVAYDPGEDRIYVVGEVAGGKTVSDAGPTFGRKAAGTLATVLALDGGTGGRLWSRTVPECQQVLNPFGAGTLLARSRTALRMSFACVTGSLSLSTKDTLPGQSGLVDLRFVANAAEADAPRFDVTFHAISGNYFNGAQNGIAAFDPVTDRFFLQSLSHTTPGAWVFDGRLDAWVGFVTAKDNANFWTGFSEVTGHLYMGGTFDGATGGLVVADGRSTPVPGGDVYPYLPRGFIATSPLDNRLFLPQSLPGNQAGPILVIADEIPSEIDDADVPFDTQTQNITDAQASYLNYTGSVSGYALNAMLVGGTTGAGSGVVEPVLEQVPKGSRPSVPFQNSRGGLVARAPALDLRRAGAGASAMAASADYNTEAEVNNDPNLPDWAYQPAECLDGGGAPQTVEKTAADGTAKVVCDLGNGTITADAAHRPMVAGPAFVQASTFTGRTDRAERKPATTSARAESRGVRVALPGGQVLVVGRVVTTVATTAYGRPGTAKATWTREVDGVAVEDGSGGVVQSFGSCRTTITHDGKQATTAGDSASCDTLAGAVKQALQVRVQLLFPVPDVAATPKGAFAGVRMTDGDYWEARTVNDHGVVYPLDSITRRAVPGLEVAIYNDARERSRVLLQFAAIEASSIYQVAQERLWPPMTENPEVPGDVPVAPPVAGGGEPPAPAPADPAPVPAPTAVAGPVGPQPRADHTRPLTGLVVSRRNLGEAALVACLLLLFAAAAGSVLRRERLVRSTEH